MPSSRKEKERQSKPLERETQPVVQKPKAQRRDAFDVPSSDDEVDVAGPVKRTSPPKMKKRSVLIDDRGVDEETAPWEKKRGLPKPTVEKTKTPKKEDLKQKLPTSNTANTGTTKTRRNVKEVENSRPTPSTAEPPPMTAAARLAARRQRANGDAPMPKSQAEVVPATKRPGLATDSNISNPRKRARRSPPAQVEAPEDVDMKDAPDCDLPPSQPDTTPTDTSIFDLPDHSDHEQQTRSKSPSKVNSPAPRNRRRRGQLPSSSTRRAATQKGASAPGRLMEMLPQDISGTDTPTTGPSRSSRGTSPSHPSSPARRSVTPARTASARDDRSSPVSSSAAASPAGSNKTGTLTPKQKQLWSHLLPSDDIVPHDEAPTPSSLAMGDLRLTAKVKREDGDTAASSAGARKSQPSLLAKSQSDVSGLVGGGRKRVRLVDRLKASRVSEDEDDEDEDEGMEDVRFSSSSQPLPHIRRTDSEDINTFPPGKPAEASSTGPGNIASTSSQHQPRPPLDKPAAPPGPTTGAKITYARTRSYLPEDNLEDGLLFSLPSTTPQRPTIPHLPRQKPSTASNRGPGTSHQPHHQQTTLDPNPTDEDSDSDTSVVEGSAGGGGGHPSKSVAAAGGPKPKPARLRTIHELRASGRNARFRREVEGLLEEITLAAGPPPTTIAREGVAAAAAAAADEDSSAGEESRARRSKALVVLARNFLLDVGAGKGDSGGAGGRRHGKGWLKKTKRKNDGDGDGYLGRFLAEGFEMRLVGIFAEREGEREGGVQRRRKGMGRKRGGSRSDEDGDVVEEVGDLALGACLLALLVSPETSVHVLRELGDPGVVGWLVGRLGRGTDVDGLIGRERGIGLDEVMAGKFEELVEILRGLDGVWDSSAGNGGGDAGGSSGAPEKMTMRGLSLKALELLVRRSRREGDRREFLSGEQLEKVLLDPSDNVGEEEKDGKVDLCTAISLLESLSTSALALAWPGPILHRLAALFPRLATADTGTSPSSSSKSSQPRQGHPHQHQREQQHTLFLLYRLTLNLTTDHPRNCSFFATRETFSALLSSISASFLALDAPFASPSPPSSTLNPTSKSQQSPPPPTPIPRALTLDLLILALGIAINLTTDYSENKGDNFPTARLLSRLIDPADPLSALFARLIRVFRVGRVRIDRELDSSPPPPDVGEEKVSSGETGRGREREGLLRREERRRLRGEEEGEGDGGEAGQGDRNGDGDGDVGFNIAWGYLAVFLGKCCSFPSSSTATTTTTSSAAAAATASSSSGEEEVRIGGREVRRFVAGCLQDTEVEGDSSGESATGRQGEKKKKGDGTEKAPSGEGLEILVQAVEEFVLYHQRVDGMMMNTGSGDSGNNQGSSAAKGCMMDDEDGMMRMSGGGEEKDEDEEAFAGQEGKEVWSAFTEKLRLVLERLKSVVREDV